MIHLPTKFLNFRIFFGFLRTIYPSSSSENFSFISTGHCRHFRWPVSFFLDSSSKNTPTYNVSQFYPLSSRFFAISAVFRVSAIFRDFPRPKNFPVVGRNFFGFFKSKYICVQSFGCLGPLLQFLKSISNATARFWPVF